MSCPNVLEFSTFLKQIVIVIVMAFVKNLAFGKYFIWLLQLNNLLQLNLSC